MIPQRKSNLLKLLREGIPTEVSGDETFQRLGEKPGDTLFDRIPVPPTQERDFLLAETRRKVRGLIRTCCTPREERIIWARMEGEILEDIGRRFGVCRERIRQIERDALRKLRKACKVSMPGMVPGTGAALQSSAGNQGRSGDMAREFVRRLEER